METVSPSNKALLFNNSNRPSNRPESAVKPRPRVRPTPLFLHLPNRDTYCLYAFLFIPVDFTKCLEAADVQTCSWFLEQLKAVSPVSSDAW